MGGPAYTVYWLCKAIAKKGIVPTVISTTLGIKEKSQIYKKYHQEKKGEIQYIEYGKLSNIKLLFKCIFKLRSVDIIHFSSLFYWPNFFISFFAVFCEKKIVWSTRGETSKNALKYGSSLKSIYIYFLKTLIIKKVVFHSTCEKETNEIKHAFGNDIKIIEIPNYIKLKQKVQSSSQDYFLFTGRLHPIKAVDNLIMALSQCPLFINSKYTLKIAGDIDGTQDSINFKIKLFKLVEEYNLTHKIEFLGHIQNKKDKLYSEAYFLILPSHTENFGNVVIESLAQGTPVIASKGTPWKILEDKQAGFWVDNDLESLINCISEAIELSKTKYEYYRINALELVQNEFDIDKNIYKWLDVYEKIIRE